MSPGVHGQACVLRAPEPALRAGRVEMDDEVGDLQKRRHRTRRTRGSRRSRRLSPTGLKASSSGATLATVVGVLVEVPVMLSVCAFCNRTRRWFPDSLAVPVPASPEVARG
jgi:hypothetical protein